MTAAATTGPKSEPRPTSSTPAIRRAPDCHAIFSNFVVQRRRLSKRSLAAAAERVLGRADLGFAGTKLEDQMFRYLHLRPGRLVKQGGKELPYTQLQSCCSLLFMARILTK